MHQYLSFTIADRKTINTINCKSCAELFLVVVVFVIDVLLLGHQGFRHPDYKLPATVYS